MPVDNYRNELLPALETIREKFELLAAGIPDCMIDRWGVTNEPIVNNLSREADTISHDLDALIESVKNGWAVEEEGEARRGCASCLYEGISMDNEPCVSCMPIIVGVVGDMCKWQPRDPTVGDFCPVNPPAPDGSGVRLYEEPDAEEEDAASERAEARL